MKYALHLPKQPVLTVFDLQAVHHTLPQLALVLGGKDEPAKLPASPPLHSTAQCCSSQYFTQYFELLSDWTSAHHWFSPRSPRRSPEEPRATGGPSTPPSRPPLAFPTAVRRSGTPRHRSAWSPDHRSRWPLPPAPRQSATHASRGGPKGPGESNVLR